MSETSIAPAAASVDPVSNVLKWILLGVAIVGFAIFAWVTVLTYERAPPQPERFVTASGTTVMTDADIIIGKAGFQRADLMDYGSLYGMGSYYGEDYTAWTLMRLAGLVENGLAQTRFGKPYAALMAEQQAGVRDAMRAQLQHIDLTQHQVTLPDAVAGAISSLRAGIAKELGTADLDTGWTPAYSLNPEEAARTADFLIYCALTTVARRPNVSWSWTQNWPYEPEVGNTPTTTPSFGPGPASASPSSRSARCCSSMNSGSTDPDDAPMDPVLVRFRAVTQASARSANTSCLVAVVLLQIAAGIIMAHDYSIGAASTDLRGRTYLPSTSCAACTFNRRSSGSIFVDRCRPIPGPGDRGREARGQGALLVDLLFWISLVDCRRRPDRQLSRHHGAHPSRLVLVRQPGSVVFGDRPLLADCVLCRAHVWSWLVFRALWPSPRPVVGCGPAFLDGTHPP